MNDEVFAWALKQRWQPAIRTAPPWHDHPAYISALAQSVKDSLGDKDPEKLMVSFHGIPQRYFVQGDPYHCHCMKTARLLREELDWPTERYQVTFQSRFGREPWLQPYTDETLEEFGAQGTKSLAIMAPGFVADCLETLEELAMEGKEQFQETGGGDYHYIPCLNDSAVGLKVIETIVRENLAGWVEV